MKKMIFLIFFLLVSSGVKARKVVLISDIDDTLKRTHVLGYFTGGPYTDNPYIGLPELFMAFMCSGIENSTRRQFCFANRAYFHATNRKMKYVTAAHGWFSNFGRAFIKDSNFPKGSYIFKSDSDILTFDFKVDAITKIIKWLPEEVDIIMVGDNGQVDAKAYFEIERRFKTEKRRFFTYIHQVYSYAPDADEIGVPVLSGQGRYLTSFELALEFYSHGWIKRDDLVTVSAIVINHLSSNDDDIYEKVLPDWTDCSQFVLEYTRPQISLDSLLLERAQWLENKFSKMCLAQ